MGTLLPGIPFRKALKISALRLTAPLLPGLPGPVVLRSGGVPLHPVFWDDNYITLFPGESRTLTARVATKHLQGPLTVTLE